MSHRRFHLPFLLWALLSLCSCSSGYLLRAAYEQGKILAHRQPIQEIIEDPATPQPLKDRLKLVLLARSFTEARGLTPKESYTYYAPYDREVVSWVVVGSQKDSFHLRTWWFPIVGSVPYKGFFEKEEALQEAQNLQTQGYETSVRGALAYSTLGWFNDPILTPLLRISEVSLIQTIIHEVLHATVWIPDQVAFNESLANFVGMTEAIKFCEQHRPDLLSEAIQSHNEEMFVGDIVERLYQKLDQLYASPVSSEEKLRQKADLFTEETRSLRIQFPKAKLLKEPNNAELVQLYLYLQRLTDFQKLYDQSEGNLENFTNHIRVIQKEMEKDPHQDPFKLISNEVSEMGK